MVKADIISDLRTALTNKFENKQTNKKDDISGNFSSDTNSYPTVKAVKSFISSVISGKVDKETGKGLSTNDFTNVYKTKLQGIDDQANKTIVDNALDSTSSNPVQNSVIKSALDGKVSTEQGKGLSTNDYTTTEKNKLAGIESQANKTVVDDSLSSSSENPVQNKVINTALSGKADSSHDHTVSDITDFPSIPSKTSDLTNDSNFVVSPTLATVATTGDYDDLIDKPTLSDLGGVVTVEKQTNAEAGYISTYHVKQNGSKVGDSINIPKDFLIKSATVETVETANDPVTGYVVGDKYLDFVINTKDSSGTDEHLYVLVSDLIDTYTADGSTLALSNNQFSVATGGISSTHLSDSIPAKGITNSDINSWNAKSELTTADVDTKIEAYLTALTQALTPLNSS